MSDNSIPLLMIPGTPICPEFSKTLTSGCAVLCVSWLFMCIQIIYVYSEILLCYYNVQNTYCLILLGVGARGIPQPHIFPQLRGNWPSISQLVHLLTTRGKLQRYKVISKVGVYINLLTDLWMLQKNLRPCSADIGRATQIPWFVWFQRCVNPKTNSPAKFVELWLAFPKADFLLLAVSSPV